MKIVELLLVNRADLRLVRATAWNSQKENTKHETLAAPEHEMPSKTRTGWLARPHRGRNQKLKTHRFEWCDDGTDVDTTTMDEIVKLDPSFQYRRPTNRLLR